MSAGDRYPAISCLVDHGGLPCPGYPVHTPVQKSYSQEDFREAVTRIIGEDDITKPHIPSEWVEARNDLRMRQRDRLEEELGGGK